MSARGGGAGGGRRNGREARSPERWGANDGPPDASQAGGGAAPACRAGRRRGGWQDMEDTRCRRRPVRVPPSEAPLRPTRLESDRPAPRVLPTAASPPPLSHAHDRRQSSHRRAARLATPPVATGTWSPPSARPSLRRPIGDPGRLPPCARRPSSVSTLERGSVQGTLRDRRTNGMIEQESNNETTKGVEENN